MKTRQSGFTLIELMVVVVLIAILMTGVTNLLLSGLRGGGKTGIQTNLREQGETIISSMERAIRYGSAFNTAGGTCFTNQTDNIQFERLVDLTTPDRDWRPVQYRLDGSVVRYEIDMDNDGSYEVSTAMNGTEAEVVDMVITCVFDSSQPNIPPKVTVTLSLTDPAHLETIEYQTTVAVRNVEE